MDEAQQKQQFSFAYVKAVAAVAGCNTGFYAVDEGSIDMSVRATGVRGSIRRSPQMDIQLKCTARDVLREEALHFPLKRKNYEDLLNARYHVPKILIVVVVPDSLDDWIDQSEESLALRRCGYWFSLKDLEPASNRSTVTLRIPRSRIFSAQILKSMMQDIANGRHP